MSYLSRLLMCKRNVIYLPVVGKLVPEWSEITIAVTVNSDTHGCNVKRRLLELSPENIKTGVYLLDVHNIESDNCQM